MGGRACDPVFAAVKGSCTPVIDLNGLTRPPLAALFAFGSGPAPHLKNTSGGDAMEHMHAFVEMLGRSPKTSWFFGAAITFFLFGLIVWAQDDKKRSWPGLLAIGAAAVALVSLVSLLTH